MEGLDPGEMVPENASTLRARAVWDYKFLEGSCQSSGVYNSEELTRHSAHAPKPTAVAHDGSIAFNLTVDG